MASGSEPERTRVEFFRLGVQYFVSGRFAALTGLVPVAANLLHHAIEMFLKGALSQTSDLNKMRNFGHNIERLWTEFKVVAPDPVLDDLDSAISMLNRFETLRYPDTALREGMDLAVSVFSDQKTEIWDESGKKLDPCHLVIEDVDLLVKKIFFGAGVNPAFHMQNLRLEAKEFMNKHNHHSIGP